MKSKFNAFSEAETPSTETAKGFRMQGKALVFQSSSTLIEG